MTIQMWNVKVTFSEEAGHDVQFAVYENDIGRVLRHILSLQFCQPDKAPHTAAIHLARSMVVPCADDYRGTAYGADEEP